MRPGGPIPMRMGCRETAFLRPERKKFLWGSLAAWVPQSQGKSPLQSKAKGLVRQMTCLGKRNSSLDYWSGRESQQMERMGCSWVLQVKGSLFTWERPADSHLWKGKRAESSDLPHCVPTSTSWTRLPRRCPLPCVNSPQCTCNSLLPSEHRNQIIYTGLVES